FHLYTLAAMNEADTSVEPLDVAFLRRWRPYPLRPDVQVLRKHYGLATLDTPPLPDVAAEASDLLRAAVLAWQGVNARIARGRGPEFQIGHGVMMADAALPTTVDATAAFLQERWVQ